MSLQAKFVSAQNPQQVLLHAANARPGTPYRVSVRELQALQLSDPVTGQAPRQVWAKRQGDNLVVTAEDAAAQKVQIEVEDYFTVAQPPEIQGIGLDGTAQPYLTAQVAAELPTSPAASDALGAGGADAGVWSLFGQEGLSMWALGAAGLTGSALLMRSSADDVEDTDTTPVSQMAVALSDTDSSDGVTLVYSLPATAVAGSVLTTQATLPDGSTRTVTATLTAENIAAATVVLTIPADAVVSDGVYTATSQIDTGASVVQVFTVSGGTVSAGATASDATAPSVTITNDVTGTATGEVTYTFTFSEAITGFSVDDVTVTNGTKGTFTALSSTVYTLVVTPTANASGSMAVNVPAAVAQDLAGNANTAATSEQAFDRTSPTLTITDNNSGVANGDVIYTFTFSEAVTGFTADGVSVTNGTKGSFTAVSSTVYTLVVTPTANASGNILLDVAAGVARDGSGNTNTAAVQAVQAFDTSAADTTAPTVQITDDVDGVAAGDVTFTISFSEPVTGFSVDDIAVTNGTKGTFTAISSTVYTLVVTPAQDAAGDITVDVAADAAQDLHGNGNIAAVQAVQAFDTSLPVASQDILLTSQTAESEISVVGKARWLEWGDYDGDGDLDLLVGVSESGPVSLFSNDGDGSFTNVTADALGSVVLKLGGAVWLDYDGDGDLDIFLAGESTTSQLLQNNGGVFTNVAATAGVAASVKAKAVAAVDFDGDGDTDLFVAVEDGTNILYENNGDGTFTDVASAAGVANSGMKNRTATWVDYDGDGDLDLFVGVHQGTSRLYENNGDGTFSDVTTASGISTGASKLSGAVWGDVNGDGLADLFVAGEESVNKLFVQNEDGTFTESATQAGVAGVASQKGKTAVFADLNGDGYDDLIVAGDAMLAIYQNNGDGTFTDVTALNTEVTVPTKARDISVVDYDGDGDLDVLVSSEDGTLVSVYTNDLVVPLPSVVITDDVEATATGDVTFTFTFSRAVTGFVATDIVVTGGSPGVFTAVSDTVYTLVVSPDAESVGSITVDVPAGVATDETGQNNTAATQAVQVYNTMAPDTVAPVLSITDSESATVVNDVTFTFTFSEPVTGFSTDDVTVTNGTKGVFTVVSSTVFTLEVTPPEDSVGDITVAVAEGAAQDAAGNGSLAASATQAYNTDVVQLTSQTAESEISVVGKARWLEWGDYDGDGDLDLLVGVSESGPVSLFSNDGDGSFTNVTADALGSVVLKLGGAVWLDYDGDGDLDIFLAGESTTSQLLQNNGGVFTNVAATAGVAASVKAKAVAAVDFDGDGDTDLFVAVEDGTNILYENNGDGTFTDVASAAGVANSGMKNRTATWVDYDGDGDLDLFVGVHQGTSRLYENNGDGTFSDVTTASGISTGASKLSGAVWGDVNGDGLADLFVAGEESVNKLFVQNEDGTFTESATQAGVAGVASQKGKTAVFADLNGDGYDDLIVAGDAMLAIYQNNGDGTFTDVTALNTEVTVPTKARDISVVDYDGDGDLDVLVSSEDGTLVSVYTNDLVVATDSTRLSAASVANEAATSSEDTDDGILVVSFDDEGIPQEVETETDGSTESATVAIQEIVVSETDAVAS